MGVHILEDRLPPIGSDSHELRLTARSDWIRREHECVCQDLVSIVEIQGPIEAITNILHDRGVPLHAQQIIVSDRPDRAASTLALTLLEEVLQQAIADDLDQPWVVVGLRENSEHQPRVLERKAESTQGSDDQLLGSVRRQGIHHQLFPKLGKGVVLPVVIPLDALQPREHRLEPSFAVGHHPPKTPHQSEIPTGIAVEQIVRLVQQEHDPHVEILGEMGRDGIGHLLYQPAVLAEDLQWKLGDCTAADKLVVHAPPERGHHRIMGLGVSPQVVHIEIDHVDRPAGIMILSMHVSQQCGFSELPSAEDHAASGGVHQGRRLATPAYEHLGGDVLALGDVGSRPGEGESQLEQNRKTVPFPAQMEQDGRVERENRKPRTCEVMLPLDPVGRFLRKQEDCKDRDIGQTAPLDVLLDLLWLLPGLADDNLEAIAARRPKGRKRR